MSYHEHWEGLYGWVLEQIALEDSFAVECYEDGANNAARAHNIARETFERVARHMEIIKEPRLTLLLRKYSKGE